MGCFFPERLAALAILGPTHQLSSCPGVSIQLSGSQASFEVSARKDRRQRLRPAAGLSPRAVQVSPDPGAAAWTQRRPQPPLMCAAIRADARGTSLTQEERQAARRPAARRPALCLLSETLLQGPGFAGLTEGASSGSQQDALPAVRGTRALRPLGLSSGPSRS